MIEKLVGEDIQLRPLRPADAPDILRHINEREILRFSPRSKPRTLDEIKSWITRVRRNTRNGAGRCFVIEHAESGSFAGLVNFRDIDRVDGHAKLGYWIGKEFRRRGYTLQAVRLALSYAFKELKLHRVYAATHETNKPSIKLLEKAGFSCEGRSREAVRLGGRRCDILWYGILKTEFRKGGQNARRS